MQLQYNPDTGIFTKNNKTVGGLTNGYLMIWIDGKREYAHRLAWLHSYGYMPKSIDHINHNRADNRLCNLREVDQYTNCKNQTLNKNNKSGFVGVHQDKNTKMYNAHIMINYKKLHLGSYINKDDAIIARREADIKYGFHPNHGV